MRKDRMLGLLAGASMIALMATPGYAGEPVALSNVQMDQVTAAGKEDIIAKNIAKIFQKAIAKGDEATAKNIATVVQKAIAKGDEATAKNIATVVQKAKAG